MKGQAGGWWNERKEREQSCWGMWSDQVETRKEHLSLSLQPIHFRHPPSVTPYLVPSIRLTPCTYNSAPGSSKGHGVSWFSSTPSWSRAATVWGGARLAFKRGVHTRGERELYCCTHEANEGSRADQTSLSTPSSPSHNPNLPPQRWLVTIHMPRG